MRARTLKAMLLGALGERGVAWFDDFLRDDIDADRIIMWGCEKCGFETARTFAEGPPAHCHLCKHPAMDGTEVEPQKLTPSKVPNSLEAWCRGE